VRWREAARRDVVLWDELLRATRLCAAVLRVPDFAVTAARLRDFLVAVLVDVPFRVDFRWDGLAACAFHPIAIMASATANLKILRVRIRFSQFSKPPRGSLHSETKTRPGRLPTPAAAM